MNGEPVQIRTELPGARRPSLRLNGSPVASEKDSQDGQTARWGRSRLEGYRNFRHNLLQPAPLFFTQDHHPLWLGDTYRGRSVFLIASGPSFASVDHGKLRQPGILTAGINNSVRSFRPHIWVSVDPPEHFLRSIWLDPTIMKFVPICHAGKTIFNSDEWSFMDLRAGDCPNVVYFKRNEHFQAQQFLWEDCINWGNHKSYGGGRSVMLAALRILFQLGLRRVYLLGVDFKMDDNHKYHFEQERSNGSITGNNSTYQKLNHWFSELKPHFEAQDFLVFNCNPESQLTVFDFVPFDEAIEAVLDEFNHVDVAQERSSGLYETKTVDKRLGRGK